MWFVSSYWKIIATILRTASLGLLQNIKNKIQNQNAPQTKCKHQVAAYSLLTWFAALTKEASGEVVKWASGQEDPGGKQWSIANVCVANA